MAKLYFTVGLPASGKSTWAETHKDELNAVIHASDSIREQLGDINDQTKNNEVFKILHQRVKDDLRAGKNVVYDATNLSRKRRIHFLQNELRDIPCEKICVLFATPYEICIKNNATRNRKVPEHIIYRMYKNFEVPAYCEQWDDIQIVYWDFEKDGLEFNFEKDLDIWKQIPHENPHHSMNIGEHMQKAYEYMSEKTDNILLLLAIYLHDCGKIATKDYHDSKGNPCEFAHYYQHHLVGSYNSLFYLKGMPNDDILYISLLIGLHMHPFLSWEKSDKAREKDKKIFGEDIYNNIIKLHEADMAAH